MNIGLYQLLLFSIIVIFSLILSLQDIKKMTVRFYLPWAGIIAALACHLIFARETMWIYILSGTLMGAFYFAVRMITKGKLGMADVWFGIFQGLFLVPKMIPVCLGVEVIISLCAVNKRFGKEKFPFIPFMAVGLFAAYIIQLIFM